jgi:hypothetical protein
MVVAELGSRVMVRKLVPTINMVRVVMIEVGGRML